MEKGERLGCEGDEIHVNFGFGSKQVARFLNP